MGENYLTYQTENAISIRSDISCLAVDKTDWERLKRNVDQCKISYDWWSCVGSIFAGVAGSAFITFLSIHSDENTRIVRVVLLSVAIASAIIGVICFVARFTQDNIVAKSINDVKLDIEEIESKLLHH